MSQRLVSKVILNKYVLVLSQSFSESQKVICGAATARAGSPQRLYLDLGASITSWPEDRNTLLYFWGVQISDK